MPLLFRKIALFGLLSLADLLLTWYLLTPRRALLYEGNPLARWCLLGYGWTGLTLFKAATVFVVCSLAVVISRSRLVTAQRLMTFCCAVLVLVVLYSSSLVFAGQHAQKADAGEIPPEWDVEARQHAAHSALVDRLCEDLIARRLTLNGAIDILADSEKGKDPTWLRQLRLLYTCDSNRKCLAAYLVLHTTAVCQSAQPSKVRSIARRMTSAFRTEYGPVPRHLSDQLPQGVYRDRSGPTKRREG